MGSMFQQITAVLVVLGGAFLILRGFWHCRFSRRLAPHDAAQIALGFAFVVLTSQRLFFPSMSENGKLGFFWVALALLFISAAFAVAARRSQASSHDIRT